METPDPRTQRAHAYENDRADVRALLPGDVRRILDLGCASGAMGAAVKLERPGVEVVGVERDRDYAADAERRLDRVVCADLDVLAGRQALADDLGSFDCLIAADVLEHLVDPWSVLRAFAALLQPGGTAVISLPNVRHAETFWALGRHGTWPRRPFGLFDETHLRWFTLLDANLLLGHAGVEPTHTERVLLRSDGQPWPDLVTRTAGRVRGLRTLLTLQHVVVGRRRPA